MGETIDLADRHGIPVSQFEILTAGALKMFAEAGLSWAILEAGLGARHDATSVARPDAVVLTNVALDHTEYLGETVEEIAEEKLASLRPGTTLFLGTDDERVVEIARSACRRLGANLVELADAGERRLDRLSPLTRPATSYLGLAVAESLLETSLPGEVREKVALGGGGGASGAVRGARGRWGARGARRGAQRGGGFGGAGGRARSLPRASPRGGLRGVAGEGRRGYALRVRRRGPRDRADAS